MKRKKKTIVKSFKAKRNIHELMQRRGDIDLRTKSASNEIQKFNRRQKHKNKAIEERNQ